MLNDRVSPWCQSRQFLIPGNLLSLKNLISYQMFKGFLCNPFGDDYPREDLRDVNIDVEKPTHRSHT